ncbi:MAG: hypothetical protein EBS32_11895, partial [Actinobacteria bacterium]|nr:hypothetical protein [Actinomycetota bacterium]
ISRQQDFTKRMIKKALETSRTNPRIATNIMNAALKNVITDDQVTPLLLLQLGQAMRNYNADTMGSYTMPGVGQLIGKDSVIVPDLTGDVATKILAVFQGKASLSQKVAGASTAPLESTSMVVTTVGAVSAAAVGAGQAVSAVTTTVPASVPTTTKPSVTSSTRPVTTTTLPSVVIENNRIASIVSVGVPHVPIDSAKRPKGATREINANGMYVLPGLVDLHVHQGTTQKAAESEYYNKLWLGNGITAVRGVPFASFDYSVKEAARSAKNEITAPRYIVYQRPGTGWDKGPVRTPEQAREWVRWLAQNGGEGLKLGAERPDLMAALLDEAKKLGLGSTAHLQQTGVAQMNADEATRLGLGAVTHFYGIFESMYDSASVQPWPVDYNYNDEQDRFGQVARQWSLVTPRGEKWKAFMWCIMSRPVRYATIVGSSVTSRSLSRLRNAFH